MALFHKSKVSELSAGNRKRSKLGKANQRQFKGLFKKREKCRGFGGEEIKYCETKSMAT